MYTPLSILFLIPLFFSHIFVGMGVIFGAGSFERVKVLLFLGLLVCMTLEFLLFHSDRLRQIPLRRYIGLFFLLLFPWISFIFFPHEGFLMGSYEKYHGYFWYSGLVIFSFLSTFLTVRERQRMLFASLISASVVALLGILEYMGISPFSSLGYSTGVESTRRIISTLGNANYVAGYLLIHLPLMRLIRIPERYLLTLLFALAIFLTGSYIGIGLMVGFFCYVFWRHLGYSSRIFILIVMIGGSILLTVVPRDKYLSFESRLVLMRDVGSSLVNDPKGLMIGNGPESIIWHYSLERNAIIDRYFPRNMAIDSSHNILLDFIFSYGIIVTLFLIYLLKQSWGRIESSAQTGIILGILFFSLNVIITAPLILMIALAVTPHRSPQKGR